MVDSAITELSADRRTCKLFGYYCVADFDISDDALVPLMHEISVVLAGPKAVHDAGQCDTLNIGLYQGGKDIRVWKVWTPR